MADLQASIEELWERRSELSPKDTDAARLVEEAIGLLDSGEARVAEPGARPGETVVHEWLKRAILLFFAVRGMETIESGPFEYADKLPLKRDFAAAPVSDKLKALLVVAGKVQKGGKHVTAADVENARKHGATDKEIHDTVLIAAAFCMFNRYVDGLDTWQPRDGELYRQGAKRIVTLGYTAPGWERPVSVAAK